MWVKLFFTSILCALLFGTWVGVIGYKRDESNKAKMWEKLVAIGFILSVFGLLVSMLGIIWTT